ncbi:MAG: transporter [Solirubrobacterales bacterium]|jgi:EmrB/QacA subfamily drug resistance transporter|nr:transporter [Solirubrobacterales bacterium]
MSETPERAAPQRTLLILSLGTIAFALGQTLIIPAIPDIKESYGASSSAAAWLVTAYFLTASISTPIAGRLGDMFGKRKMLALSLGLLSVGCIVSALGQSLEVIVVGRALQGLGGGVFPLSFGIVRDEFPNASVPASVGLLGATAGVGGGIGLPLGGLIADSVDFHWIFWLSSALSIAAVLTTVLLVPESPLRSPGRVDLRGALVLCVGLVLPLYAISQATSWGWGSTRTLGLVALGLAVLAAFVKLEQRTPAPLVNMRTLAQRTVLTTDVATFLVGFGLFGSFVLIPQLAQLPEETGYGFGFNAFQAGLLLAPAALLNLFLSPLSGRMGGRLGARVPLAIGCAIAGVALALLAALHASPAITLLWSAVLGIGIGFAFSAMPNLIIEAVDRHETGEATGVNTIARNVGASLGSAVGGAILASDVLSSGFPTEAAFTAALGISAAGSLVAMLAALSIPARRVVRAEPELARA